jgi:putative chitinase
MNFELITKDKFRLFAPTSDYNKIAPALNAAAKEFGINNNREVRHWLAHLSVESAYFKHTVENLNYSAKRLCAVWPKRFPTLASAKPYANNPIALANKVYGGRLGNNTDMDGYNYRGRGFIQLTGKSNYALAGKALGIDLLNNPDLAATPLIAARIAGWYWKSRGLDLIVAIDPNEKEYTDAIKSAKANELDDLIEGTKAINGGLIGLEERKMELWKAAYLWP